MSHTELSNTFRMGRSTVAKVVYQTCQVIWDTFYKQHMPKPSTEYWESVSLQFWLKWEFPNCIGAIGERIVKGKKQKKTEQHPKFINFESYALHGIADANFKFIAIEVIGRKGKRQDTFNTSKLNRRFQNNAFGVPVIRIPPNSNVALPHVLLGDEVYPLTRYLMRPFNERSITEEKKCYNVRIKHARKTIIGAYEMLFKRWHFLTNRISTGNRNTKIIIQTLCLLHNMILDIDGDSDAHVQECIDNYPRIKVKPYKQNNRPNATALSVREDFVKYFWNYGPQEEEEPEDQQ